LKPKRFGVVRTDRIGDLILSLPVAEAIKDAVPDARVCFITSPYTAGVARCCPFIDEVAEYSETTDRLAGFVGLCREFRRLGLDVALFLRPTPRAALAAALAGVRVRAGTSYRFYSFLFNRSVAEHRKHADRHESDYNLRLLESVLEIKSGPYRPRLEIRAESRPFAEEAMSRLGVRPGHFVIVHPGSGGSARNFTPENYAWLADFIEHELDLKAVLTYGKGEEALIDRIDSMRERNLSPPTRSISVHRPMTGRSFIIISGGDILPISTGWREKSGRFSWKGVSWFPSSFSWPFLPVCCSWLPHFVSEKGRRLEHPEIIHFFGFFISPCWVLDSCLWKFH